MNLIEQLGGYKTTKEKYQTLSDSDKITIGFVEFSAKGYFEYELLEYRRHHNIFEVGDKVVEITESPETSILTVIYMSEHLMVCENDSLNASYGVLNKKPSFYVRHATDGEIKAGHRL